MKIVKTIGVGSLLFAIVCIGRSETPGEVIAQLRIGQAKLRAQEIRDQVYECNYKLVSRDSVLRNTKLISKRYNKSVIFIMGDILACFNGDYFFAVEKGKNANEWILRQFNRSGSNNIFRGSVGMKGFSIFPLTCALEMDTISEILDDPTFRANTTSVGAEGMIKLGFSREMSMANSEVPIQQSGIMTISPKNDYAITKWEQTIVSPRVPYPIRSVYTREIVGESGSIRCKSIRLSIINDSTGKVETEHVFQFVPVSNPSLSPKEFTLEHYGIPIPNEAPEDQPKDFLWWGIFGFTCLGGSFGFWWLARRRSSDC